MAQWVEATVVYTGGDGQERAERRLFNLDCVRLITPHAAHKGRSLFFMLDHEQPFFTVVEPYEYWAQILTVEQPRAVV